jgi:hypothetical protein
MRRCREARAKSIAYSWKLTGSLQVEATYLQPRRSAASAMVSGAARTQVSFGGAVKLPENRYNTTSPEAVAELRGPLRRSLSDRARERPGRFQAPTSHLWRCQALGELVLSP